MGNILRGKREGQLGYPYQDDVRQDILRLIPADGPVIGSIGCGWGTTEAVLVQRGRQVHGVDINPQAVATAATRLTSARLIDPAERTPFAAETLDGLILADVLEHIPQAWEVLAAYVAAVRAGGWVVISVPNMRHYTVLWRFLLGGDWPEEPTGIFDATHLQVMTRRRLARWCAAAGLRSEHWEYRFVTQTYRGYQWLRGLDLLTLGGCREWLTGQWQVVCRKVRA